MRTSRRTLRAATALAAALAATAFGLPAGGVHRTGPPPGAGDTAGAPSAGGAVLPQPVPAVPVPRCPSLAVAGHRGAPTAAPENTLAAFRAALAGGADWLETDVRTTRDGVPVLMHDDTVDRVTDGHGRVAELTAAQIAALHVTAGPGPAQPVPTLDDLLHELAGTRTRLLMEIKEEHGPSDAVRAARAAAASGADVVLYSFFPAMLQAAHRAAPGLPVVLVQGRAVARDPGGLRLDGIALDEPLATAGRIAREHAAGRQVYVWTPDHDADWRAAADRHADAVITDVPAAARVWADAHCPPVL
ncbi:glycerophosphodiester phosphodiesterase [Streptomyces sp. NRRL B-24484]|uniref:glycerophosphodiester phosphodiesterase n=1 Tax=Streptomyces sp. NRRL B-24484 TaxID=1463833 RepID=UPI0006940648|nr:glycerophosphodiester phosphodiesterase family protein [Streptomyces sp. NRRL B-24484]